MLNHLKIAECIFVASSIIGWVVAVVSGDLIYGVVPLSVTLLLNLINRWRFEQQIKGRIKMAIAQLHRQVSQESQSLSKQQLQEAITAWQTQLPEYLAQIEVPNTPSNALKIGQIAVEIASLEQSLGSVVDYLNSASLAGRVEHLELAIANLSSDISAMQRQLANLSKHPSSANIELSPNCTLETVSEPDLFPVISSSIPEEKIDLPVIAPTWTQVHTLRGHSDWVSCLVISPDAQILVSGSLDHTIKLWQIATGENIYTLADHTQGVLCLAISPDGQFLASGSFDQTIKLWRVDTGELLYTLRGHSGSVRSLAITPDSQTLISASYDQTIKLWRLHTGECLGNLVEEAGRLSAIALTPDGQILASGGGDGIVTLCQLNPPQLIINITGNLSSISSLNISPDGHTLAAGYTDGNLQLWQIDTAELLHSIPCSCGPLSSIIASIQGQSLIAATAGNTIKIWHLSSSQLLTILNADSTAAIISLTISPNCDCIGGGTRDGKIIIWQLNP